MKKIILVLLVMVATVFSAPHTHDGFFLNMSLGYGYQDFAYSASEISESGNPFIFSIDSKGVSTEFDIKIGGTILPSFALHATISGIGNLSSEIESVIEYSGERESFNQEVDLFMFLTGIGVTYYINPINIFFSGSVGITEFDINDSQMSDTGFGFQIALGKEWWVSPEWGLGVSAAFTYGKADEVNGFGDMSEYAINIMFSSTFH